MDFTRFDGCMRLSSFITYAQHEYITNFGRWPTRARLPYFRREELYKELDTVHLYTNTNVVEGLWDTFNGLTLEWWHNSYIELE